MTTSILVAILLTVLAFAAILLDIYSRVGRNRDKTEGLFENINKLWETQQAFLNVKDSAKVDVEPKATPTEPAPEVEKIVGGKLTLSSLRGQIFSLNGDATLVLRDEQDLPINRNIPMELAEAIKNESSSRRVLTFKELQEMLAMYDITIVDVNDETRQAVRTKIKQEILKTQKSKEGMDQSIPDVSSLTNNLIVRYTDGGKVYENKLYSRELMQTYLAWFPNAGFAPPSKEDFDRWHALETEALIKLG